MSVMIAGKLKIKDWQIASSQLKTDLNNIQASERVYQFFNNRMDLRYIQPIELIINSKINNGEGFSVVALICTTIEALASCRVGLVYKKSHNKLVEGKASKFYSKSGKIFKDFLIENEPFKKYFDQDLSADFYTNVRCALLHEAAVKNNWLIRSNTSVLIVRENGFKILNRNILLESLKEYLCNYKKEFLANELIKINLMRKYDLMCEEWI